MDARLEGYYCNDFFVLQETGSLKQCANARTRKECGCTNRMIMTDEARYSDCKMRVCKTGVFCFIVLSAVMIYK